MFCKECESGYVLHSRRLTGVEEMALVVHPALLLQYLMGEALPRLLGDRRHRPVDQNLWSQYLPER